jgi:CRISPR-associated protein Csm3
MSATNEINLYGRILLSGQVRAVTGLHIGRGKEGLTIGGVDNQVVRDALTNEPFIPGSSLKGKLRSLAEKREPNLVQNKSIGKNVKIHVCETKAAYRVCPVCRLYGVPGQMESSAPTRLVVRDIFLNQESKDRLNAADTDLPFTEVKYEAAIDRVTSEATPRPLERVPADSVFAPFEIVFSVYEKSDLKLLARLVEAMRLLEDDYLGGSGSRGSGKIRFEKLAIQLKPVAVYMDPQASLTEFQAGNVGELLQIAGDISAQASTQFFGVQGGEAGNG